MCVCVCVCVCVCGGRKQCQVRRKLQGNDWRGSDILTHCDSSSPDSERYNTFSMGV